MSAELEDFLENMMIDEHRTLVLTKYNRVKNGLKRIESDHNVIYAKFKIECNLRKYNTRKEVFHFKNNQSLVNFKNITNKTNKFRNCFNENIPFDTRCKRFYKRLNEIFYQSFQKVRLCGKNKEPNKELVILLQKISELKNSLLTVQCHIAKVILKDKISQI